MIVKELVARLGLDVDEGAFSAADAMIGTLRGGLAAAGALLGAVAVGLAGAAAATASYAGEIDDMAQRTGLASDTLQELRYVAGQTGTDLGSVASGMQKLAVNMANAKDGNDEASKAFRRLGVSVLDANGNLRNTDQVLLDVADKIAAMENPTARTAAVVDVFGRSGTELIPMLRQGGAGIAAFREEARALGLVLDADTIAAADELGDSMDALQMWLGAVVHMIGAPLMAPLTEVVKGWLEWAKANRQLLQTRLVQFVTLVGLLLKPIAWAVGLLARGLWFLVKNIDLTVYALGSLGVALLLTSAGAAGTAGWFLALGVQAVAAAVAAAAAWIVAAAPVVALAGLILLLVLLVEDFYVALTGGESALLDWGNSLEEWAKSPIDGDWWPVVALKALIWMLTDVAERLPEALGEWGRIFADYFSNLGKNIAKLFFAGLRGDIKGQANALLDILPGGDTLGQFGVSYGDARRPESMEKWTVNEWLGRGGAAGPSASVQASVNTPRPAQVIAPQSFTADFVLQTQPGQDPDAFATATREQFDDWYSTKMRETFSAVEGG